MTTARADDLGWDRATVARLAALSKITEEAWSIVTATARSVTLDVDTAVTADVTTVTSQPFTENLLRDITGQSPRRAHLVALNGNRMQPAVIDGTGWN